jgi:hypothetical protein
VETAVITVSTADMIVMIIGTTAITITAGSNEKGRLASAFGVCSGC